MSAQSIVKHPDQILRRPAQPITEFGDEVRTLTDDLIDTLQQKGGIGLCAPQIAQSVRIVVADLSDDHSAPEIYINPEIISKSHPGFVQESCLSLPGIVGNVVRSTRIQVLAHDKNGKQFQRDLTGMYAVCLQHEIDHLNGILFIDRFTTLRKLMMRMQPSRNLWRQEQLQRLQPTKG